MTTLRFDTRTRPLISWVAGGVVLLAVLGTTSGLWVSASQKKKAVAIAMTRGNPDRAPDLVRRYGCGGCHSIAGVPGADGKVGPALEGLRARVFIAGRVRNSADDLIGWIVAPQDYAPGSAMPVTGIGDREARDVAAFLYAH